MASSVLVVKANGPEASSSQDVHICSRNGGVRRPNDALNVEDTHQNTRVCLLLEVGGRFTAKVGSSRNVGGSVEVLTTRVKQVKLIVVELQGGLLLWFVVDHCTIGTNA